MAEVAGATCVGPLNTLKEQGLIRTRIGAAQVSVVYSKSSDAVFAFDSVCPHMGTDMTEEECAVEDIEDLEKICGAVVGPRIICPWHGWDFDMTTGYCRSQGGFLLPVYSVTEKDGLVYISNNPKASSTVQPHVVK